MAPAASLILFFLLSQLALLTSAEEGKRHHKNCPPFNCGKLGKISFPFTNTTLAECGLCKVNGCNESVQKIQLVREGRWYEVESIFQADNIVITDKEFQKLLNTRKCEVFNNLTLPNSPSIHYEITHNQTLLKCNSTLDTTPYGYTYLNNTGCGNYSIYYSDLNHSTLPNLSPFCSIIQLPVDKDRNSHDLFTWLTAKFSLDLNVSPLCHNCYFEGGQCEIDSRGEFHCANGKEGTGTGTHPKRKEGKDNLGLKLALAAGIGVFIIVVCCLWRKFSSGKYILCWKKEMHNHGSIEAFLRNYSNLAPKRYSHSDIKKMTNSFKDKLGQGGYGSVYKGKLLDGRLAAVKFLNNTKGDGEEFINEVASISRTSHVNIVSLLGFCFEGSKRALIYEYMPNGSLEKYIFNENSGNLDHQLGWQTLFQISLGIARGLEYLHRGCNARILHFDIKPHNILLDDNFCPKISDFGLAKICPSKESIISMLGARGTAGYIAPELFCRNYGGVSHKSDVYSYGMMVLEMVGGRHNIDVGIDHTSEIYFPHWIYKRLELYEELGLQHIVNKDDKENARKMIIVGLWCIQTNPSNRPAMSRVVDMLEGGLESLQIPPRPFLSSPSRSPVNSSTACNGIVTL